MSSPKTDFKPDSPHHQNNSTSHHSITDEDDYSLSDLEGTEEEEELSANFPPDQAHSPLLPNRQRSSSYSLNPFHQKSHLINFTCLQKKLKSIKRPSIRTLKIPCLILLFLSVMIGLLNVPWSGIRKDLDLDHEHELYTTHQNKTLKEVEEEDQGLSIHHLSAPDSSIHASFIGLGASIQTLMVKDRHGSFRDIVLGYDNISNYLHHPAYPRFGSVVGRYANRIKNSSFTLSGRTYQLTANEHDGLNTLHGGSPGWDRRPFKLESKNLSYISFAIIDADGQEGFPHQVVGKVEYELLPGARWKTRMSGVADGPTPLMLSSHVYWNLDAYTSNHSALDHFLHINATQHITTDGILIPTGQLTNLSDTALDFLQPREIGSKLNQTQDLCGTGCLGYDNAWIYNSQRLPEETAMEMWSESSGIKMEVKTDQKSVQVYTCNAIEHPDYPIPQKVSHQGPKRFYENHSCVVIEQQSLIDGLHHPVWDVVQIYEPRRPYEWNSIYTFTIV